MAKDFFGNSDEPKPRAKKKKKVSPNIGGLKHKKKRKRNPPLRSSSPKEKELLTDEERHKRRVLAAQKAAKTRKENEAKLSPEEREQLRQKRANILRDNLERKKFKEGFEKGIYLTGDVTPEEIDEIEEQLAWEKYDTLIGEINQGYNTQTVQALIDIINRGVENQGINDYMDKVSSDLISEDIRVIVFADSLSAQVVASIQRLVSILDYTASDYGDTLALVSEIGEILAGEIYSRRYQEFNLP